MNLDKFKGVFCALNAIYDENDNVDLEKMKALVRVYNSLGVPGVYACGSTGEGFLLSTEERKQVARAVKEAAGDDFTVIVHIGCASTKESIELAKDCEKVGIDAVSAVPCVYYHLGAAGVERKHIFHDTDAIGKCDRPYCGACHYLRSMRGAYQHGNGKEQYARY